MTTGQEEAVVALAGSHERYDNIDLLRAVAVVAVMLFHYTARFPQDYVHFSQPVWRFNYGFMGVDLFFIISGYCIYMTATHCRGVGLFWARRFSRLQPAYMAAILVTFAVVSLFGLPDRGVTGLQALANMAWLNGIGVVPHVDGVYWSLISEIKLYLLFGLLYFGLKSRGDPILWWSALCLAGAAVMLVDRHSFGGSVQDWSQDFATFVFPASAFFLMGMLIYRWAETPAVTRLFAIAVFAGVCCLYGPGWKERIILIALFPLAKLALDRKSLTVPAPLVFVGFVSYPLYLLHQNIGVVALRQLAPYISSEYARIAVAAAISLALAALIGVAVEHRFRKPLERASERLFSAIVALPWQFGMLRTKRS